MARSSNRPTAATIPTVNTTMTELVNSTEKRPSVTAARDSTPAKAPDAQRIYAMILAAAERQVATTSEGRAIIAAGLGDALLALVQQIAGNAANPIANEIEDALTGAP